VDIVLLLPIGMWFVSYSIQLEEGVGFLRGWTRGWVVCYAMLCHFVLFGGEWIKLVKLHMNVMTER
jgi:hypothetical protein